MSLFKKSKRHKQNTYIHCMNCGNELISSNSFVRDDDGFVTYKCKNCGETSIYDFIHYPIPYIVTFEEYLEYINKVSNDELLKFALKELNTTKQELIQKYKSMKGE